MLFLISLRRLYLISIFMLFVDEKNAVLEHSLEVVVSSFLLSQGRFLSTKVEVS